MSEPYDMGENHLNALIIKLIGGGVCLLIAALTSCSMHENYLIEQALTKGIDPLSVRCALGSSGESSCALAAAHSR